MSEPQPMKVEPSGWIHVIPLQPGERKALRITVGVFAGMGIIPLLSETLPNGAALVILGFLALGVLLLPPLLRAVQPRVNLCPRCNIRTTYNPHQTFCGRCGYRPERR